MKEKRLRKGLVFGMLFSLLAAMVVITVPTTVTGTVLDVGVGRTYATIGAALTAATANDEIIVYDGTYYENPTVAVSPINIYSANGAGNVIVDGGNSGSVFSITVNDVIIDGFTIRNSGSSESEGGIKIQGTSAIFDCTIKNCIITQNSNGILLDDTRKCIIENNEIIGNSKGIYMIDCDGSAFSGTQGNTIKDNEIAGSELDQQVGIYMDNSDYQKIQDNDADLNSDGNYGIHDHEVNGIYMQEGSDYNLIEGNIIESNLHGMSILGSDYNEIKENVLEDNTYRGIDLAGDCTGNEIYHNNFYNNNGATSTYDEDHIQGQDGSENNDWYDTSSSEGNYWSDWTTPDNNNDDIIDYPYILDDSNQDPYPLESPY